MSVCKTLHYAATAATLVRESISIQKVLIHCIIKTNISVGLPFMKDY